MPGAADAAAADAVVAAAGGGNQKEQGQDCAKGRKEYLTKEHVCANNVTITSSQTSNGNEKPDDDDNDNDNDENAFKEAESSLPNDDDNSNTSTSTTTKVLGRKRHGARNQHKIKFFLRWLVQTFPSALEKTQLQQQQHVDEKDLSFPDDHDHDDPARTTNAFFQRPLILDVAGGKGELAARLCFCNHQRVVMVDPRPADIVQCYENVVFRGLPKKWQSRLREKQKSNPQCLHHSLEYRYRQLTTYFDDQTIQEHQALHQAVHSAQLLIGMHADSATEAIVDIALQYNKPFVVVPCCVFPNFFPRRRLLTTTGDGGQQQSRPVRSYHDFCDYLLQKDARLQQSVLPFEGRNIAIWWKGT